MTTSPSTQLARACDAIACMAPMRADEISVYIGVPLATVYRWAAQDSWPRRGTPRRYDMRAVARTVHARRAELLDA